MLEYVRSYLSKRAKQRINKQILSFDDGVGTIENILKKSLTNLVSPETLNAEWAIPLNFASPETLNAE